MKRLLLIAALVAPTWLYSCSGPKSVVPDPSAVIQETFDKLPPIPEVREIPLDVPSVAPVLPSYKPKAKHHAPAAPTVRKVPVAPKAVPRPRPPAAEAPVEPLPPQQGVICIFPLNMVPQCTPEPAGRMP